MTKYQLLTSSKPSLYYYLDVLVDKYFLIILLFMCFAHYAAVFAMAALGVLHEKLLLAVYFFDVAFITSLMVYWAYFKSTRAHTLAAGTTM